MHRICYAATYVFERLITAKTRSKSVSLTEFVLFAVFENADWQLLEPIMNVEIVVPAEFQGGIIGMVSRRSGIITSIEGTEFYGTVSADVSIMEVL